MSGSLSLRCILLQIHRTIITLSFNRPPPIPLSARIFPHIYEGGAMQMRGNLRQYTITLPAHLKTWYQRHVSFLWHRARRWQWYDFLCGMLKGFIRDFNVLMSSTHALLHFVLFLFCLFVFCCLVATAGTIWEEWHRQAFQWGTAGFVFLICLL